MWRTACWIGPYINVFYIIIVIIAVEAPTAGDDDDDDDIKMSCPPWLGLAASEIRIRTDQPWYFWYDLSASLIRCRRWDQCLAYIVKFREPF